MIRLNFMRRSCLLVIVLFSFQVLSMYIIMFNAR